MLLASITCVHCLQANEHNSYNQQIGHVLAVRDMHQCSTTTTVLHTCQSQTQVIINQLWAHKKWEWN